MGLVRGLAYINLPLEDSDEEMRDVDRANQFLGESRRLLLADLAMHMPTHFKVTALGGHWTLTHRGTHIDNVQGYGVKEVQDWMATYNIQKTARFSVAVYGAWGSKVLALSWCQKLQFFYNMYLDHGPGLEYGANDAMAFSWSEAFEYCATAIQRMEDRRSEMRLRRIKQMREFFLEAVDVD